MSDTKQRLLEVGDKIYKYYGGRIRNELPLIISSVSATQAKVHNYCKFKRETYPTGTLQKIGHIKNNWDSYSYVVESSEVLKDWEREQLSELVYQSLPKNRERFSYLTSEYLTDLYNVIQKHTNKTNNEKTDSTPSPQISDHNGS